MRLWHDGLPETERPAMRAHWEQRLAALRSDPGAFAEQLVRRIAIDGGHRIIASVQAILVCVLYARDRTETTSAVWLGLTTGCAVCHDHKFDPIPQADYYRMASTFTTTVRGNVDLAVTINNPQIGMSLLAGNGDGTFDPAVNVGDVKTRTHVDATDWDGDGRDGIDLAPPATFDDGVLGLARLR